MNTTALRHVSNPTHHDDLGSLGRSLALDEVPLPRLLRLSVVVLCLSVVLFVTWAALTPVKELARTEGQVIPSGYTRVVQHLEGGLVREILVREGDKVQAGQVVMRIDGAGTEEDMREQRALAVALALQTERLQAVLATRTPDFAAITDDPVLLGEQQRLFDSTRSAQLTERSVLQDQVAQKQTIIERLQSNMATAQDNLALAQEARDIYAKLIRQGHTTRPLYLKKQEELNSARGQLAGLNLQVTEAKTQRQEYQKRLETLIAQQRDGLLTELQDAQTKLAQASESLKKRADRVDRLDIKAPVTGYVKGLRANTIGAVVPSGETLMEIVPTGDTLVIELRIPPEQIGRVAVGQPVQVKVDSYDYVRWGTVPGTLTSVSASVSATTFVDEVQRREYYRARVRLERDHIGKIPGRHPIIPGMTVDSDIVIGEKSVLAYLLKPIRSAMYNALTEQ